MKTIKEILTESNGVLKLAVHNGVFHADDVLCVAMIKNKLKELGLSREVEIIRSRNPETLAQADIIMDVGGLDFSTQVFQSLQSFPMKDLLRQSRWQK